MRDLGTSPGAFLRCSGASPAPSSARECAARFLCGRPVSISVLGPPPPSWYIDDLMRHEGHPYYVGLLRAAELHGASHQAVMEFQVVTDKKMPELHIGRSRIDFSYRKDMAAVIAGIEDRKTDTGRMKVSSVALTALDLVRYPHAAGGIDHVANTLSSSRTQG